MKQAPFTPPNQLTTADLQNTLTSKQVAEELGITTSCLANWRMNTPSKLPFLKAGGATNSKCVYLRIHLDQFKKHNLVGIEQAA